MKEFERLKLEIIYFEVEDVVRTSVFGEAWPGESSGDVDDLFGFNK